MSIAVPPPLAVCPSTPGVALAGGKPWIPRCVKPDEWPPLDRLLWEQAFGPGSLLEDAGAAARLAAPSREKMRKGYGVWLSFLAFMGCLDPEQHPAERVTKHRLRAYLNALLDQGNRAYSILGRFIDLKMTLKAMVPNGNFSWIMKPNGRSLKQLLRPESRPLFIPDAAVLVAWALRLMDNADLAAPRKAGLIDFRDGLLIAFFASRGRRLRSIAMLRVGYELIRTQNGYRVELDPHQVKTKKRDVFDLPAYLTPYIDRYLEIVLPLLGELASNNAMWIGINGKCLEAKGIQIVIFKRSKAEFGQSFGPHRFRYALATAVADAPSAYSGADVLGIGESTNQKHYDKASDAPALRRYQEKIEARASAGLSNQKIARSQISPSAASISVIAWPAP